MPAPPFDRRPRLPRILEVLADTPGLTAWQVSQRLGDRDAASVSSLMRRLVTAGTLTRRHQGRVRGFRYWVRAA